LAEQRKGFRTDHPRSIIREIGQGLFNGDFDVAPISWPFRRCEVI